MELTLRNITVFRNNKITVPDAKIVAIGWKSALGKTTIAQVIKAFLTSNVDTELLTYGADRGEAELILNGNKYKLVVTPQAINVSSKLVSGDYGEYLVFTEGTELYKVFIYPFKEINVNELANLFIKKPQELVEIENRLSILSPNVTSITKAIESLENEVREREARLSKLREELKNIEVKLSKLPTYSKAKEVIKKKELEEEISKLKKELSSLEGERTKLLSEVQADRSKYEKLKHEKEKIEDEIRRLQYSLGMLANAKEGYEKIKEGLLKLQGVVDVLYDLNITLFGAQITSDIVSIFINDCDDALKSIVGKESSVRIKLSNLEKEKESIDMWISEFVKKHEELSDVEAKIKITAKELREKQYSLLITERKVAEILKELGMTEDEVLSSLQSGEVTNLMQKRSEVINEIKKVEYEITDLKRVIGNYQRDLEKEIRKLSEYKELKEKYSRLRNELIRKKKVFKEVFKKAYKEVFKNIKIPDFIPDEMRLLRPPHTYSEAERFLLAFAYQYALINAFKSIGYEIPLVVIDFIVPLDKGFESAVVNALKELETKTIILKTSNENKIEVIK